MIFNNILKEETSTKIDNEISNICKIKRCSNIHSIFSSITKKLKNIYKLMIGIGKMCHIKGIASFLPHTLPLHW